MGSVEASTFHLEIPPRPVLLNLQGGRRTDPETEPAFEAVELLRRHFPSKTLYSYTPEDLTFVDDELPGSYINFYEIEINPQIIVTLITINAYCGNDFTLAAEIAAILGKSVARFIILSSFPSPEPLRASQRTPELYFNIGQEISPGVFQFAFGGILAELGFSDITEIIVTHPGSTDLGTDAVTISTIFAELFTTLGCPTILHNTQSSLIKTLTQLQDRYTQNAKNLGLW